MSSHDRLRQRSSHIARPFLLALVHFLSLNLCINLTQTFSWPSVVIARRFFHLPVVQVFRLLDRLGSALRLLGSVYAHLESIHYTSAAFARSSVGRH